ncbi:MAG: hypothetical protein J6R37_00380 [Clostridia bacterium]|nr:hypothetical protein [Clostridia bacterium]
MVYSRKNKTLVALMVLTVMALTLALGACTDTNSFVPNTFIPTVESVDSNGGVAVRVNAADGDWIYYVNNYQSSNTIKNEYTDEVKDGQIVRIKVSDLEELIEMYYDKNDSDAILSISKKLYEKAQIVVPYVVYSGNTEATAGEGIFVFGDRLYYRTPNYNLDAQGYAKNEELLINSCKLNGSDTQTHLVLADNTTSVYLCEVDSKVYAVYTAKEDGVDEHGDEQEFTYAYFADLSTTNAEGVRVSKENQSVSSFKFDQFGGVASYLDKDGALCSFVVGNGEEKVLIEKQDNVTIVPVSTSGTWIYYTKDSDLLHVDGIYAIDASATNPTETTVFATNDYLTGTLSATYVAFNNGTTNSIVVTATLVPLSTPTTYDLFILTQGSTEKDFVLAEDSNTSKLTLVGIGGEAGKTLYYTDADNYLYSVDLTANEYEAVCHTNYIPQPDIWATYDVCGEYTFLFNSNGDVVITVEDKENSGTYISIALEYIVYEDEEEAE